MANLRPPKAADPCASDGLDADTVLDGYAVDTPSGVRLVQTGRIERPAERCLCCGSHATAREVLGALPGGDGEVVVADLEPGANDLLWARPGPDDVVLVVTDASHKGLEVANRLLRIAAELGVARTIVIANKLRDGEAARVRARLGDVDVLEVAFDAGLDGAVPDARRPVEVGLLTEHLRGRD